ncbi:rhomboid family intramembrane serine protease [Devosia sp.]|uniref:rhomboid family intramembrane serine protease n=1 Tax=Devosia sp. TaxID=1871048 RepID=UPI002F1112BD
MSDEHNPQENPPTQPHQPVFLLPASVTWLGGLLIAVHLASTLVLNEQAGWDLLAWFGFIPIRLLAGDTIPGGWLPLLWTPFTHAFLHAGWDHVLFNTVWLAVFATPVARRYGGRPMLAIFLLGAAAGAAAFAATTLPSFQVLIGASGGVAALTGAAVRFVFQPVIVAEDPESGRRRVLGRRLASFADLVRDPRPRYFTLIWVVLNAAVPLLPLLTGANVQIAWQAHLGGFFAGLLAVGWFEHRTRGGAQ